MVNRNAPFGTIESAQEFLTLLSEQIDEAISEVREELSTCVDHAPARRVEAWQVVLHTLTQLSWQISESRRLTNNLRTLRNLMSRTSDLEHEAATAMPAALPH
jgi:hypothetical protein